LPGPSHPLPTLFPYTTLFRSVPEGGAPARGSAGTAGVRLVCLRLRKVLPRWQQDSAPGLRGAARCAGSDSDPPRRSGGDLALYAQGPGAHAAPTIGGPTELRRRHGLPAEYSGVGPSLKLSCKLGPSYHRGGTRVNGPTVR